MLGSLTLRSFRNLADDALELPPGRQLLLGNNGAGKTSLLEAVYLLATSRSFRTSELAACVRHEEPGFHLAATVGEEGRRLEIGWQEGRRLRLAEGRELPLSEHVAIQPVVLWSAAEAELLAGAPEHGRRLLDRGLVSTTTGALYLLGRYRQVLEQKRKLLASGRGGGLASWNELLAEAAAELVARRAAYAQRLAAALERVVARLALSLPPLRIDYVASPRAALAGREATAAALAEAAASELQRGVPLIGPHRDRLRLSWGGRELRAVASAGERKAFGLLLAAAQGELVTAEGRSVVYLLDDADAELDRARLAALWQAFAGVPQALATSSRPEVWEGLSREATWEVAAGRLRRC